jgi:hypothetical protein
VVVGGGVAGVCCTEELASLCSAADEVLLISATSSVKGVSGHVRLTNTLDVFDVKQRPLSSLVALKSKASMRTLHAEVLGVDYTRQRVLVRCISSGAASDAGRGGAAGLAGGEGGRPGTTAEALEPPQDEGQEERQEEGQRWVPYDRLCICTGSRPRLVGGAPGLAAQHQPTYPRFTHPSIIGIRDTESVEELCKRLLHARRVLLVGNGGIALEFVHAAQALGLCDELVWVVREPYIGNTFFDASASRFFLACDLLGKGGAECEAGEEGEEQGEAEEEGEMEAAKGGARAERVLSRGPVVEDGAPFAAAALRSRSSETKEAAGAAEGAGVETGRVGPSSLYGAALGPRWTDRLKETLKETWGGRGSREGREPGRGRRGGGKDGVNGATERNGENAAARGSAASRGLRFEFSTFLASVEDGGTSTAGGEGGEGGERSEGGEGWPAIARLGNGAVYGCDVIISATGVVPNVEPFVVETVEVGSAAGACDDGGVGVGGVGVGGGLDNGGGPGGAVPTLPAVHVAAGNAAAEAEAEAEASTVPVVVGGSAVKEFDVFLATRTRLVRVVHRAHGARCNRVRARGME